MKFTISLLLLLFTWSASNAQSSSLSSTETTSEEGYEFKVKVSKDRLATLQKIYNELTGHPENPIVSGVATREEKGVTVSLDTRKKHLLIFTNAQEGPMLSTAKAKAEIVRERLGQGTPPPPPPVPGGRG